MTASEGPRDVRIGIVGAGIRGQLFARALAGQPGVKVTGLTDVSARALDAAAGEGFPVHGTLEELLAAGNDGVVIATPDFAHLEPIVAVAAAGADLLIEKPLATSTADARQIVAVASESGVQAYVAFENRWSNTFRTLHTDIRAGRLGQISSQYLRLSDVITVPTEMIGWAARSSPAWFLMPHTLDLALWFSRGRVATVQARATRGILMSAGVDCLDSVHAILTLTDGSVVTLESGWVLPRSYPSIVDFKVEVIGSDGAAFIDHQDQMMHVATDRFEMPRTLGSVTAGRVNGPAPWMVQSFARRLQGYDEPMPSLADGLHVTEVIEAIHLSTQTAATITLE